MSIFSELDQAITEQVAHILRTAHQQSLNRAVDYAHANNPAKVAAFTEQARRLEVLAAAVDAGLVRRLDAEAAHAPKPKRSYNRRTPGVQR